MPRLLLVLIAAAAATLCAPGCSRRAVADGARPAPQGAGEQGRVPVGAPVAVEPDEAARLERPRRPAEPEQPLAERRADVDAAAAVERRCPSIKRRRASVFSVGSSTMGGLAKILDKELEAWGVKHRSWAVASTGLARPDFHDWPAELPRAVRRYDPDVFVVVLGTNDNQAVRVGRQWFRPQHPRWREVYAARVDKMLQVMSAGRERTIFWVGPNRLDTPSSRRYGKRINEIMRERVEAFDGPATFIDLYSVGSRADGKVRKHFKRPDGRVIPIRGSDDVHLGRSALRWILAEPVLAALRPCLLAARKGPLPRREAAAAKASRRRAGPEAWPEEAAHGGH